MVNLAGTAGEAVTKLLLLLVLTRGLGAGATGAFLEALAIFQIVAVLGVLGVDTGIVRFAARDAATGLRHQLRARLRTVLGPVLIAGLVGTYVVASTAQDLAMTFGSGQHAGQIADVLRVMAPFLPVAGVTVVVLAATRGVGNMAATAVVDRAGRGTLQVLACLVVIRMGGGLGGVAIAWGAAHVVALLFAAGWFRALTRGGDAPPGAVPPSENRAFWRFTLPRAASSAFRVAIQWLDVLLVGAMASTRDAAVYAVASRLLQAGAMLSRAGAEIAQPMVSGALARRNRSEATDIFRTTTTWLVLLSWPFMVVVAVYAPTILAAFGEEFRDGATVLMILAGARLLSTAAGPADMVLLMAGRSTSSMAITATSLTLNLALNIVLIPRLGMVGAALAWTASILVSNGSCLVVLRWQEALSPFGSAWVQACLGSLGVCFATSVAVLAVLGQSWQGALAAGLLAATVQLVWMYRNRRTFELEGLWRQIRRDRTAPAAGSRPATVPSRGSG